MFTAAPPWTKANARCELSDLCIVWFRNKPSPLARITFLQAKLSKSQHSVCAAFNGRISETFVGDSTQWHLLHRRPGILPCFSTFDPPPNLLKNALLPSVGSFCVFHALARRTYSFFYASADVITCSKLTKPGKAKLTAATNQAVVVARGYQEQKWTCCPYTFGVALFQGLIGTPIDRKDIASTRDEMHREEVRHWVASCLATAIRQQQALGPTVASFLQTMDLPIVDDHFSEVPGRAMIFIRGDDEEVREGE
jgi:hypothetical protein